MNVVSGPDDGADHHHHLRVLTAVGNGWSLALTEPRQV